MRGGFHKSIDICVSALSTHIVVLLLDKPRKPEIFCSLKLDLREKEDDGR